MARLIDADEAKLTANDYVMFRCQLGGLVDVVEFLDDMPTVDAVPVVRCKDCAVPHNKYTGCPMLNGLVTPPDFYCPFGERKDGDGNGKIHRSRCSCRVAEAHSP